MKLNNSGKLLIYKVAKKIMGQPDNIVRMAALTSGAISSMVRVIVLSSYERYIRK
jgi:uncharacterized protein (DUF927 family)